MSNEIKINLDDKIICLNTGNELSGFRDEIKIKPFFEDACRVYSYYDSVFINEDFNDVEEAINNFIEENDVEINEFFPVIKADPRTGAGEAGEGQRLQTQCCR